ncbi:alpha-amylase family glycosyl hydrolase [Bittarella sp. HCP28S3_D9]|uniref:alpha-amylase family glycosyl hydrolase n=1 Tax=Bittarella sp. HCP28S3_D9 TaxID=3440253 RepID=UPI003F8B77A0
MKNRLKLLEIDPLLAPFEGDIRLRDERYRGVKKQLLGGGDSLSDFANGSLYYGFHPTEDGWVYREWAPHAEAVHLFGDFNGWDREAHPCRKLENGNWELRVKGPIPHQSEVKVQITADGTFFDRIPLYVRRAVQDPLTFGFNGQIWWPDEPFVWTDGDFVRRRDTPPLIYECHVGMAGEEPKVSSFREFTETVLPRVKRLGYNTVQLMAVMEHPYYASFGYQISNFFAVSSRLGTPEDLKALINTAHGMGIAVFLDLVHSHAAKNTAEGIAAFDGTEYQFFHAGPQGDHPAWNTKLFDYGKPQVLHFLLSNLKYWLTEYHFDGFRFDGVTSMLYHDHGLGESFDSYQKYFSMNTDVEAVTYLQLANDLIREVSPNAVTVAEDMSGMPGMCVPIADGGIGFDYRLSMGVPDFWIKTLKSQRDEDWDLGKMWFELTTRRPQEKNIGYCESHDQAMVGDKTLIFWLADAEMYWHMDLNSHSDVIERAIALHKMIRLVTFSLAGEGYLNFMGNEFGHPEWIDMPREGNGNSYQYARRQWSLADSPFLRYQHLQAFDMAMIDLQNSGNLLGAPSNLQKLSHNRKLLVYRRGDYLFALNFHPVNDCKTKLPPPEKGRVWQPVLHTAETRFGGWMESGDIPPAGPEPLFLPRRSGVVYKLS